MQNKRAFILYMFALLSLSIGLILSVIKPYPTAISPINVVGIILLFSGLIGLVYWTYKRGKTYE